MNTPLYLATSPMPAMPGADAVFQDIERLARRFNGGFLCLYPFKRPSPLVPGFMMGFHNRPALRRAAKQASLIHVFSATLTPLPCLAGCGRPVVYSVTAACGGRINAAWFKRHTAVVVVSHERDLARLRLAGINAALIRPGLDLGGIQFSPPPVAPPFTIMSGSAPWTRGQFQSKGVDLLLRAAAAEPGALRVVFLWRGILAGELRRRVAKYGVERNVEIIDAPADVGLVLARCHAAVVLAAHDRLVKAWPHSAIESLAAGRPALLSRAIPMADYVEGNQAGVAVKELNPQSLAQALNKLESGYPGMSGARLRELAARDFALENMLSAFADLYKKNLGRPV